MVKNYLTESEQHSERFLRATTAGIPNVRDTVSGLLYALQAERLRSRRLLEALASVGEQLERCSRCEEVAEWYYWNDGTLGVRKYACNEHKHLDPRFVALEQTQKALAMLRCFLPATKPVPEDVVSKIFASLDE